MAMAEAGGTHRGSRIETGHRNPGGPGQQHETGHQNSDGPGRPVAEQPARVNPSGGN